MDFWEENPEVKCHHSHHITARVHAFKVRLSTLDVDLDLLAKVVCVSFSQTYLISLAPLDAVVACRIFVGAHGPSSYGVWAQ